ncbi:MAG: nucleoside 2-deoxyribosyltransferase [Xanthobacteraceae bacterium]|jgi:nucleoside 2-deoxyribosyltransferase|nr:nucleoside 2-deoxyribosyltransferase [Xanthobacteraceae bacterium]
MARSIYLAGPEVFLPDAAAIGAEKRRICAQYGFTGLFPLDNGLDPQPGKSLSAAIFTANMKMLAGADFILANLTPFRGISADVGTVVELGAAYAMGKPVFGYSNVRGTLVERVAALPAFLPLSDGADGRRYAADGLAVEDFGLVDNLMIAEALHCSGTGILVPDDDVVDKERDLGTFERCVRAIAAA